MISEQTVLEVLKSVNVPVTDRSLIALNLLNHITITNEKISITLANAGLGIELQEYITHAIRAAMAKIKATDVTILYIEDKPASLNQIKHVIAVMSGKGGVGKSAVTALLAIALRRAGNSVGILDADITGSSIPRMFGIKNHPLGSENGILPVSTESGINIISMNLLLPEEESAVIWRAPLLTKAIQQFWAEVLWGNLDYLIIDLPPGTADAPLTVMQSIPINGVIIVATPQGLVEMIVKKAVNMAEKMNKPVIGIVENMSYFYVPELDKKYELFGRSKVESLAKMSKAPILARLPIDPELARLSDAGKIEDYEKTLVNDLGAAVVQVMIKTAGQVK